MIYQESVKQRIHTQVVVCYLHLKMLFYFYQIPCSCSKCEQVKVASIGQAIMQIARPRTILAPIQVGLGVQLHHHFASKFLIDTLNKHGFCCSYSEVTKFEHNAAVAQSTDIPSFTPRHFVQYVADNVDHNIRTIDGMNMGMIAATTPAIVNGRSVPRITVSAEDISAVGTINILPFIPTTDGMQSLTYSDTCHSQRRLIINS